MPVTLMAETSLTNALDPVKQFSVFAENRVGRLYDLTKLFKDHNVHIMAITVLDTTDSAILRVIVDDPEKARDLMVTNGFPYTECPVLAVEILDESQLKNVLAALLEAEINIHYVYSFLKRPEGRTALAINVEDGDIAAQALNVCGFRVLTQRDISR
ncbi:MAG: acetolactate synthase [Opitutales bacterium]